MPHSFPRKAFQAAEVVPPDDLNEAFQDIAGKLAGRLNEHDINGPDLKAKIPVVDDGYYKAHLFKRASDVGFTRGGGAFFAKINGDAGDAMAEVSDTEGWQSLTDVGGSTDMAVTVTTGEDTLFVLAAMQSFAWRGTDTAVAAELESPPRLQYALRVDGAIFDDTITGAVVYPDPPPQEWYRAATAAAKDFDYRHQQYIQGTLGLNNSVRPARISRALDVRPGSHTIEVVARRIPPVDYKTDNSGNGATVQVGNRRLWVLRYRGAAGHTGDAPDTSIAPFDDGDTLTATRLTTGAFTVLSAAINDLGASNLERGALRNEHLPSKVYGVVATRILTAGAAINSVYPGYATNGAGWTVVNDGAGTNLRITGPTAGEWRLDNNPGTFVVIANVQVVSILWNVASADLRGIACFALRITNSAGTVTVIGETEMYLNTHHPDPHAADQKPVNDDIPLMWVIDSTMLSAANRRITRVEVVASVWDGTAPGGAVINLRTYRGLIYGYVLKDTYLT